MKLETDGKGNTFLLMSVKIPISLSSSFCNSSSTETYLQSETKTNLSTNGVRRKLETLLTLKDYFLTQRNFIWARIIEAQKDWLSSSERLYPLITELPPEWRPSMTSDWSRQSPDTEMIKKKLYKFCVK